MKRNLLLGILILAVLLLACVEEGGSAGGGSCYKLVVDCPGIANDMVISNSASDLVQWVEGSIRYFTYYQCGGSGLKYKGSCPANCSVGFEY